MRLVCQALQLYGFIIFASIMLSWFPMEPGSGLAQVYDLLRRLTDPVLDPVRRLFGASMRGIDFSPLIVILGITVLTQILC